MEEYAKQILFFSFLDKNTEAQRDSIMHARVNSQGGGDKLGVWG